MTVDADVTLQKLFEYERNRLFHVQSCHQLVEAVKSLVLYVWVFGEFVDAQVTRADTGLFLAQDVEVHGTFYLEWVV